MNKTLKHYEIIGDKLMTVKSYKHAERAFRAAQNQAGTCVEDIKRLQDKILYSLAGQDKTSWFCQFDSLEVVK